MQGELVCAWCNQKKKDVELVTQGKSHGICPACLLKVFGFTVQELSDALAAREAHIKLGQAQLRRQRREAQKRRASHVR